MIYNNNLFSSNIPQAVTFHYAEEPGLVIFKTLTDAKLTNLLKNHRPNTVEEMCLTVQNKINNKMRIAVSKELQEKFARKEIRFAFEREATGTAPSSLHLLNDNEINVEIATDEDHSFLKGAVANAHVSTEQKAKEDQKIKEVVVKITKTPTKSLESLVTYTKAQAKQENVKKRSSEKSTAKFEREIKNLRTHNLEKQERRAEDLSQEMKRKSINKFLAKTAIN